MAVLMTSGDTLQAEGAMGAEPSVTPAKWMSDPRRLGPPEVLWVVRRDADPRTCAGTACGGGAATAAGRGGLRQPRE